MHRLATIGCLLIAGCTGSLGGPTSRGPGDLGGDAAAGGDRSGGDHPGGPGDLGDAAAGGDRSGGDHPGGGGDPGEGDSGQGDPGGAGDTGAGDPGEGDDLGAGDPGGGDPGGGDPSGGDASIPTGAVLIFEGFEDTDWASRGWYDGPNGTLSTAEVVNGSSSFECTFQIGERGCAGGTPSRNLFAATESVYLSFWIKHSTNWQGSGVSYHPHLFHFVSDADSQWVGPANSHLTTYIEHPTGRPMLALQDSLNVDDNCILRNNDTFVGCNGDFSTYPFTESRSVCACNGLLGFVDGRDCFDNGYWYSSRSWRADQVYFQDTAGPYYKGDWHFIEAYFEMNSVPDGAGVPDGRIRYWYDGELMISSDEILLRTGALPDLAFNQFLIAPYIGPGSPVEQTFWVDDLTVATGRP